MLVNKEDSLTKNQTYTPQEVSILLRVSLGTVRRWIASGALLSDHDESNRYWITTNNLRKSLHGVQPSTLTNLMTSQEVADWLRVSERTVVRWITTDHKLYG